eukprot:GHUV01013505.1.p1 GENE.GHUV01013505.1~~GHUV01013505.1.p1  ORF type:complete len:260 (+),score=82.80 GHUV01013505.1:335-1114(+)
MATFATRAAPQQQLESPQLVGGNFSKANGDHLSPLELQSAKAEVGTLTEQYETEAALLSERCGMCGVSQDVLSSQARLNLQLVALMASTLRLSKTEPELIFAAWATLLKQESAANTMYLKFRNGEAELAQKLRTAQAKKKVLQQVLHDVQSQQKLWGAVVQDQKKMTAQFKQKTQQYNSDMARFQKHLDRDNFDETITHAKLVEKSQEVAQLQQMLTEKQEELSSYHDLPPSLLGAELQLSKAEDRLNARKQDVEARIA